MRVVVSLPENVKYVNILVGISPKGTGSPATGHPPPVFEGWNSPNFSEKKLFKKFVFNSFLLNLQNLPVIFL